MLQLGIVETCCGKPFRQNMFCKAGEVVAMQIMPELEIAQVKAQHSLSFEPHLDPTGVSFLVAKAIERSS